MSKELNKSSQKSAKPKIRIAKRFAIILAAAVVCLSAVLIAHCIRKSETPVILERGHISSILCESDSKSNRLTDSETDEFVRRFNLFNIYRQNNKNYSVSSDAVLIGTPVTYTVSFDDNTEMKIVSFADGVYNLGGETVSRLGKTTCSAAGVVKNTDAYEEYRGMLF